MTPPPITIWTATNGLREVVRKTYGQGDVLLDEKTTLQQLWRCQETGETEWRDVPVEEER